MDWNSIYVFDKLFNIMMPDMFSRIKIQYCNKHIALNVTNSVTKASGTTMITRSGLKYCCYHVLKLCADRQRERERKSNEYNNYYYLYLCMCSLRGVVSS